MSASICFFLMLILSPTDASEILKWRLGIGVAPQPQVMVDNFYGNDVAQENLPMGPLWPFSSILQTFTHDDATLRTSFYAYPRS